MRRRRARRSLDDFCRLFFSGGRGRPEIKGYRLDDVVAALKEIEPGTDWKAHFARRVETPTEAPPLDGITSAGWKLAYTDKPTDLFAARSRFRGVNLTDSIGLLLGPEGAVSDVVPDKRAAQARPRSGNEGGRGQRPALFGHGLGTAVANTRRGGKLDLLVETGDFFKTSGLDYHDGPPLPRTWRRATVPRTCSRTS